MRDDSALNNLIFSEMDVKGTILSVETEHLSGQSFFSLKMLTCWKQNFYQVCMCLGKQRYSRASVFEMARGSVTKA